MFATLRAQPSYTVLARLFPGRAALLRANSGFPDFARNDNTWGNAAYLDAAHFYHRN